MSERIVSGVAVALLLIAWSALVFDIQPVKASGAIYIRADGNLVRVELGEK